MIERYCDSARALGDAVDSLTARDLDAGTSEGRTARQVIHHIADAELVEGVRLRRILSEDTPRLPWIDEEEQAHRLHDERSVETSVGAFQCAVLANASLLARLRDDEWLRAAIHSLDGRYTVEDWLRKMSQHAHDHVAQMLRAAGRADVSA